MKNLMVILGGLLLAQSAYAVKLTGYSFFIVSETEQKKIPLTKVEIGFASGNAHVDMFSNSESPVCSFATQNFSDATELRSAILAGTNGGDVYSKVICYKKQNYPDVLKIVFGE